VDIGSANQQSFQQASLLVMAWDTLGYILLHQNHLDEARDYLDAAWHNDPRLTLGLHYGDVLQKLGQKAEALRVDQLSWNGIASGSDPDALRMKSSIQELQRQGFKASVVARTTELQNMRIFHIPQLAKHSTAVSAMFRLQLQAGGIRDALRVSGEASLDSEEDAIRKLVLPTLVPAHSDAYLLRDAEMYCEPGEKSCEFVLMPLGSIAAEQAGN
jgi:tetratricopeptide (TPR) repeat protein